MLFQPRVCHLPRSLARATDRRCSAHPISVALALLSLLLGACVQAGTIVSDYPELDHYQNEREQFIAARQALESGDAEGFNQLLADLTEYPLYRYLIYENLRLEFKSSVDKTSVGRLNQFEKQFDDIDLTRRLTRQLQRQFVEQEDWSMFLALSKSRVAAKLDCALTRARYETGQLQKFDEVATQLWIKTQPEDSVCSETLVALEAQGIPGIAALWERIFTAIDKNRLEVATAMLGKLASGDRQRVRRWIDSVESPEKLLLSDTEQ